MNDEAETKRARGWGKWLAIVTCVLLVAAVLGYAKLRGPSGATSELGGELVAKPIPELPADEKRWVNGAPISIAAARDKVLLVEAWHPA